jgi:nucleotide-binding universal stress UspA family protein
MYKRMLIPLDGSAMAEAALVYAKELAAKLDLDVVLLHVQDRQDSELHPIHQAYVEHMAETLMQQLTEVKKGMGIRRRRQRMQVRAQVTAGYPPEEILRCADENKVDFILMTTHGRSGVKRWIMGSVADKVLRASTVPVWLVRTSLPEKIPYDKWPSRTFLVALDGSELAESTLPHVEILAKQPDAEQVDVVLFMVCEPLVPPAFLTPESSFDWGKLVEEHITHSKQAGEQYLSKVGKRLADAGIKVASVVVEGEPADEIIKYTNENPFTIIVMATHGRSGLSRWVYGSVVDKVLSGASRSVFLVRAPSTDGAPWLPPLEWSIRNLPPI